MGQKIHPHGFRVGLHRKWSSSWMGIEKEKKNIFFQQLYVEKMLKSFLFFYAYTKTSLTKKLLLVDVKIYKFGPRRSFIFVFCYKMRTKRRKQFLFKPRGVIKWNNYLKYIMGRRKRKGKFYLKLKAIIQGQGIVYKKNNK